MNAENTVISVEPRAYRRKSHPEAEGIRLPILFCLACLLFFLIGILFYAILSPSPAAFSSAALDRFVVAARINFRDLPQNFFDFLMSFREETWLLFFVFLSSLTFLAPAICGLVSGLSALRSGVAVAHAMAVWHTGGLAFSVFTAFVCKESLFCAILFFFSSRSISLSRRLAWMEWRRIIAVCREICSHFLEIAFTYLIFLAAFAAVCFII